MNGIVDVYEHYFQNLMSFQFDFNKRKQHSCLVCTNDFVNTDNYQICSRQETEDFIVNYLEHLKIFGYSMKSAEIVINSIRENGILSSNVKGNWKIKKHHNHEVVIIEHSLSNENLEERRAVFLKNLLLKPVEAEKNQFDNDSDQNC